jgi:hypothetical protein
VFYLFSFTSNDTGNTVLMMSENNSAFNHFQSFTFSEGSTASMTGGFTLIPGTYDYIVRQTSFPVLNIASASSILETGLMTILPSPTASCYIWKETQVDDYVYYEPCGPTPPGLTGV